MEGRINRHPLFVRRGRCASAESGYSVIEQRLRSRSTEKNEMRGEELTRADESILDRVSRIDSATADRDGKADLPGFPGFAIRRWAGARFAHVCVYIGAPASPCARPAPHSQCAGVKRVAYSARRRDADSAYDVFISPSLSAGP